MSVSRPDDGGGGPGGGQGGGVDGGARRIVISAPLCFAAAKRGSIAPAELRSILLGYYSGDPLTKASRSLLSEIKQLRTDFNLRLANRRNSKDKPEAKHRLDADDFMSLIAAADEASLFMQLPIFATDDPDLVPSRQLLEGGFQAIMRQFALITEQYADIKSSIQHMGTADSYAAVFPPLGGPQGCAMKDPVRQRVRYVAPPASDGGSESEANMTTVRNLRNAAKAAKRQRESDSPPSPPARSAPLSYSSAAASAPKPSQPARRPELVDMYAQSIQASGHTEEGLPHR